MADTKASDMSLTNDRLNSVIFKTALENIPLLSTQNYSMWKTGIINLLELLDLYFPLTSETLTLSPTQNIQLRTILVSKLDHSVHSNIITAENRSSAKKMWNAVVNYFASTEASNRARVFRDFSRIVLHILVFFCLNFFLLHMLTPSLSTGSLLK